MLQAKRLLELCQVKLPSKEQGFALLLDSLTNPSIIDAALHDEALSNRYDDNVIRHFLLCGSVAQNLLDHLIARGLFKYVRAAGSEGIALRIALRRFVLKTPPSASTTGT